MGKRYKIATAAYEAGRRGAFRLISSADLAKYTFAAVAGGTPEGEVWTGACYCWNEDCTVRGVTVEFKEQRDKRPALSCPLCGSALELQQYQETVPLLPQAEE